MRWDVDVDEPSWDDDAAAAIFLSNEIVTNNNNGKATTTTTMKKKNMESDPMMIKKKKINSDNSKSGVVVSSISSSSATTTVKAVPVSAPDYSRQNKDTGTTTGNEDTPSFTSSSPSSKITREAYSDDGTNNPIDRLLLGNLINFLAILLVLILQILILSWPAVIPTADSTTSSSLMESNLFLLRATDDRIKSLSDDLRKEIHMLQRVVFEKDQDVITKEDGDDDDDDAIQDVEDRTICPELSGMLQQMFEKFLEEQLDRTTKMKGHDDNRTTSEGLGGSSAGEFSGQCKCCTMEKDKKDKHEKKGKKKKKKKRTTQQKKKK